ncbi:MAG TPA: hypothetical protein VGQ36_25930 [Thermoanaerobaculia bacterium]|jgi:hypothetical protein|nr:hypothetical protein [Thermoanaerobaculia bacterium]
MIVQRLDQAACSHADQRLYLVWVRGDFEKMVCADQEPSDQIVVLQEAIERLFDYTHNSGGSLIAVWHLESIEERLYSVVDVSTLGDDTPRWFRPEEGDLDIGDPRESLVDEGHEVVAANFRYKTRELVHSGKSCQIR